MNPHVRWDGTAKGKICYCCMRPKTTCRDKKCVFESSVPEVLICQGCAEISKEKGWAPFNIMYCRKVRHGPTRAPYEEIRKAFEKYMGKFPENLNDDCIKYSVNFTQQVFSLAPCSNSIECTTCEKPSNLSIKTPTINTQTGIKIPTRLDQIVPEVDEQSAYLMQILRIGDEDVLTFFDSGANTNLVNGDLAIDQNFQIITKKPTKLTVVGGGSISTEMGRFRFNLGPTESGDYHELKCQGISSVTSKFERYDLREINEEFKSNTVHPYQGEALPLYAAGDEVKLLIGIKNNHLNPTLVTILPSGVGVYKSPFIDIFGSRLIYAGPHSVFSKANSKLNIDLSHAVFHMRESILNYPGRAEDLHLSIPVDKRFNISINPTPIPETTLTEMGGEIGVGGGDYMHEPIDNLKPIQVGAEAHFCSVLKVSIPIARMRELVGENESDNLVTYRCEKCAKCVTCMQSPRLTSISLQESLEQSYIEKSITMDYVNKQVIATLPFIKDPVEFLSKKHGTNSNYRQAKRIYLSQCRKGDLEKEGMKKAHKELVDKGFMIKLQDLPSKAQDLIKTAGFRHFYPWFIVVKDDSLSTPVRMVVDPSQTHLNIILPKGENKLGNILDIVIRNRGTKFSFSSDVSKLYNQVHLHESAYPYSLFLYHDTLDPETEPEIYVMVRAWYGVVSTGNQAGYALDKLAEEGKDKFPAAKHCLTKDRYVDDILSGADTEEERNNQISQVQDLLSTAGFSLKYVVLSGMKPDIKASSDGETVKLLGYKWNTELDILYPGVSELNLNRKKKGVRKANPNPIVTKEDAEELLSQVSLTRRIIISKIAEIFDPLGLWEPIKLQLKLQSSELNSIPWDKTLNPDNQVKWKKTLAKFTRYGELSAKRFPFSENIDNKDLFRLVCLSDAGKQAGGAAVYMSKKCNDGSWSTALLCSKSKLMKGTVPRNELSAILLMTELAYIVKRSLGSKIGDIIYLTDSTIALSWIHNTNIKVRAYIFTRVQAARRMIELTTSSDIVPLFHIDGKINLADLLTKPHELAVEDLGIGSTWQEGASWMNQDFSSFPISKYHDLTISRTENDNIMDECFIEPFRFDPNISSIHSITIGLDKIKFKKSEGRENFSLIVDPVSWGWLRSLRIMSLIIAFPQLLSHRTHTESPKISCNLCISGKGFDPRDFFQLAREEFFRCESKVVKSSLSSKQLSKYKIINGIYYFIGRLAKENPFRFKNLDSVPFLDTHSFAGPLPVVLVDSPILYSLIMNIHCKKLPHAGVEITVKEVFKEVMVPGGLRRLIKRIKEDCTTCRLLERKVVEIEMSEHPSCRTIIAPPFNSLMCDIAFGFKGSTFKNSRSTLKFYALVCVCLLTGATNLLLMEGLETQDLVAALERHSARHGVPSDVYVDCGTQLMSLKHVRFSIRDVDAQLYDSLGIRVHVSNAKAHSERGRVERKIRSLREMMERMGNKASNPMTSIQWETLFAKISSDLNDLPIARGDTSTVSNIGFEILTPNRILLGRNNSRSLQGQGFDIISPKIPTSILERNRLIYNCWYQLFIDNIHMFTLRPNKWNTNSRLPKIDDVVLFTLNDSGYDKASIVWKLGKISQCQDRKVEITFVNKVSKSGNVSKSKLFRSVRDVSIIFSVDELFINTNQHHESLFHALFDQN